MRTVKAEQRRGLGLALSRLAAGRAAALQERAQADPTIYSSSCTNKPRQWSGTHRHLTASATQTLFSACPRRIPLPPSSNEFHEGSLTFLGQTVCFVPV